MINKVKSIRSKATKIISQKSSKEKRIQGEIETALKRSKIRPMAYLGDHKALTETIFGHSFFVCTTDYSVAPHILTKGYWELWITQAFLEIVEEGMNVLEIGANIGYYTVLAAWKTGCNGHVYAFEADSHNFDILHRNIEVNGFTNQTSLFNKAVYEENQKISFYRLKNHHGSSSTIPASDEYLQTYRDNVSEIQVDAICLDDFFRELQPKVDLIKIDAEGAEPKIFRGMTRLIQNNKKIKVICEFAPELIERGGESPKDFLENLTNNFHFSLNIIDPLKGIVSVEKDEIIKIPYSELYLER